jgi:hypothetical protein
MNRDIPVQSAQFYFANKGTIRMRTRKTLLAIAIVASSLGVSLATYAANVVVDIDVAPPASRYENAPARVGYNLRTGILSVG